MRAIGLELRLSTAIHKQEEVGLEKPFGLHQILQSLKVFLAVRGRISARDSAGGVGSDWDAKFHLPTCSWFTILTQNSLH